ncbi:DOPA 4,5-dioxygenase family protein [Alloalcanivorax mobilis]|uniref:DOPA 4,5-dioxygenase family protein n=1 Tax=Alloalcanivorax mobilis TaxID=2019569 RepID=UPI0018E4D9FB|nr:DOPA 4,5-dioxygenase family protein [Alloalcanivorax mobilis]
MIHGFHAHVYYDEHTFTQAAALCQAAHQRFDVPMGRLHRRPVGPHPCWSCQLSISIEQFQEVLLWLMQARNGLSVFIHGLSGDDLRDHTELVMWLGRSYPLDLSLFGSPADASRSSRS